MVHQSLLSLQIGDSGGDWETGRYLWIAVGSWGLVEKVVAGTMVQKAFSFFLAPPCALSASYCHIMPLSHAVLLWANLLGLKPPQTVSTINLSCCKVVGVKCLSNNEGDYDTYTSGIFMRIMTKMKKDRFRIIISLETNFLNYFLEISQYHPVVVDWLCQFRSLTKWI